MITVQDLQTLREHAQAHIARLACEDVDHIGFTITHVDDQPGAIFEANAQSFDDPGGRLSEDPDEVRMMLTHDHTDDLHRLAVVDLDTGALWLAADFLAA